MSISTMGPLQMAVETLSSVDRLLGHLRGQQPNGPAGELLMALAPLGRLIEDARAVLARHAHRPAPLPERGELFLGLVCDRVDLTPLREGGPGLRVLGREEAER